MNTNAQEMANKHKDETQAAIERHQRRLIDANIWRTCLSCINYQSGSPTDESAPYCRMYKATQPPQIIVHGCRDWEDDIPF